MYLNRFYHHFKSCAIMLSMAAALLLSQNCTELGLVADDEADQNEELLALLFLNNSQCNLGGASFTSSGVSCSLNNATGSGTLTALSTKTDRLSLQVTFQLPAADSSIQLVAGGTVVADSTAANYFKMTPTATTIEGAASTNTSTVPGNTTQTWCFEAHFGENPDHLVFDNTTCTSKAASSAKADAEGGGTTRETSGGAWGFVLNNASVTNVTVYSSAIFTD
ncbi:MAG: hypothetical protein KDK39_10015 [Leptospiraceae bacterium]|nr:hypothetical protein [Leptospiraceae bacterium]